MSGSGYHLPDRAGPKAPLRERALAARAALPQQVRAAAAHRLQAVLLDILPVAGTVAGYLPVGTEPGGPDLPAVLSGGLGPRGRLLLPVLRPDRSLDWALYQPGGPGELSATDPPGQRLGSAAIGLASLVVVPALAVDRQGVRLGRGGGSYDRALPLASPEAHMVALLYDGELVSELPAGPHDQRVSAVIMPAPGLVRLPATGHRAG